MKETRLKQERARDDLFGRQVNNKTAKNASRDVTELQKLFPKGARLRAAYKGETFRARIQRNGKVRFGGEVFKSLGLAAKKAAGRSKLGWLFWQAERGKGHWVKLHNIRKAGTPLLPN